jgi:protoporphyrinogen oxidase
MDEEALGQLACNALATAGLPLRAPLRHVEVRRLRYAYPIYTSGYEAHFDVLDEWIGGHDSLLTFGRQGLFAHDNTHHALFMAYSAADCLDGEGGFDRARWRDYRRVFETHVVED